jgi:hypothetical protein
VTITKSGFVVAKLVDFKISAPTPIAFRFVLQADSTPTDGGEFMGVPTTTYELPNVIRSEPKSRPNRATGDEEESITETRSLCVPPNSAETPQRCGAAPGLCVSGKLSLRIDRFPARPWTEI